MFCLCNPLHTIVAVVQRSDTQSFFLDAVSRRSPRVFFSIVKIYALCKLQVRAVKWLLRPIQLSFHRPYRKIKFATSLNVHNVTAATSWYFLGESKMIQNDCNLMLYLKTKHVFKNFDRGRQLPGFPPPPRGCGPFQISFDVCNDDIHQEQCETLQRRRSFFAGRRQLLPTPLRSGLVWRALLWRRDPPQKYGRLGEVEHRQLHLFAQVGSYATLAAVYLCNVFTPTRKTLDF